MQPTTAATTICLAGKIGLAAALFEPPTPPHFCRFKVPPSSQQQKHLARESLLFHRSKCIFVQGATKEKIVSGGEVQAVQDKIR
jgi:hypothetical protein